MGFDLEGCRPANESGEFFSINIWWWGAVWLYVCKVCEDIISDEDKEGGNCNDGHLIAEDKALQIAKRLREEIASGRTKKYEEGRKHWIESLPDEVCDLCKGTGERHDQYVDGTCNSCKGSGIVRPWITCFPFSEECVRKFTLFCENCGGFEIF